MLLNNYLQRLDKRLTYLVLQHAGDRYRKFKKDMNRWLNDIAIFEIASYLDISPETLSRIRK